MNENRHVEPFKKTTTVEDQRMTTSALLAVWGMGCPNCAARIRNSLLSLTGVVDARVVLAQRFNLLPCLLTACKI